MLYHAGRIDLEFNRRGRVSPSQWLFVFRRTLYQPAAVIAPILFLLWWIPAILTAPAIPIMSFGMGVIFATVVFAIAVAWYRPLFLDLILGKVAVKEGELRKGKTLGVVREDWYVMVGGVAFSMSREERDRLEPGTYRVYILPRTQRLVGLQLIGASTPQPEVSAQTETAIALEG